MSYIPTPAEALEILKKYNQDAFHLRHGQVVSGVLGWYAQKHDPEKVDYWKTVGMLHDIDFELYPEEHCQVAPRLLSEVNASEEMIHAICSHGFGLCSDVEPANLMENILFTVDELTGLIGAAARMRPSKSVMDMELSSLKKKFKDKKFAAGCSRDVIKQGAERLGWDLDEVLDKTIQAMRSCEASIADEMTTLGI